MKDCLTLRQQLTHFSKDEKKCLCQLQQNSRKGLRTTAKCYQISVVSGFDPFRGIESVTHRKEPYFNEATESLKRNQTQAQKYQTGFSCGDVIGYMLF